MRRSSKGLIALLLGLTVLLFTSAVVYMLAMTHIEGDPRTFTRALEFAAETLSTTGYGGDHQWDHPLLVAFVIVLQFVGVFLIFLIFPIYLIPVLEERFEARLPTRAPDIDGAVLIYQYGPAVATLVEELERAGWPTVIVEEEDDEARRLIDQGRQVVFGRIDDGVLNNARLERARALVANGGDDENTALILAARQAGFDGDILALVEEPYHRRPIMLAGATAVFTPRHILGAALAARASRRLSPTVAGVQALGRKLVVSEVRIGRASDLAGATLAQADIGRRTGVTVIGQWVEGRLVAPPTPDMRLEPDGILIVAGSAEGVEGFSEKCLGMTALRGSGHFVLAGYGEVGRKVAQLLRDVGEELQVIDRRGAEGVDLVGDILDHRVLEDSGIERAQAAIVAVDSDSATLFATVIIKDYAPEVPVIARVNRAQNVERIHRAGADFALSVSEVAGQILAGRLLGQEALSLNPQLKLLRVSVNGLEDQHPYTLGIREKTGASVVAVERGDELLIELDPDFRFRAGDSIYVCGSHDATRRYEQIFGAG